MIYRVGSMFSHCPLCAGSALQPRALTHSVISHSAISRYGDYVEGIYSRSSVSSDGKFPPTPSTKYINLAMVERGSEICDNLYYTLHGQVDQMLQGKLAIGIDDILKPSKNGSPISLVLVEGPPGIGKSTLAWELCRRWDRKQYDLVVLLRLREREVQQIVNVADLFPHIDSDLQTAIAKNVLEKEGGGVLFIFDGFDELPDSVRTNGFLLRVIKGRVLPKSSILVTSRPTATRDLYIGSHPQVQRHIEILGFTQEHIREYASSILQSEKILPDFLLYLESAPMISSLMYVPLNAAIVIEIYRANLRRGNPIPRTLTQVYTQLCMSLLQRYFDSIGHFKMVAVNRLADLPSGYYSHFLKLSQLAFEQFQKHNVVFYSPDVPKDFVHFGFLDGVPALYGGGGVSYNFPHLTLQEFFAAYHITHLPNGKEVFHCYSMDDRWQMIWRFVSGLTNFQYFDSVRCDAFASLVGEHIEVKNLFLHCLFEGQSMFDYAAVWGKSNVCYLQPYASKVDGYTLGYCITNCLSITSWHVHMDLRGSSDEGFMRGLNSNHSGNGNISHLVMHHVHLTGICSYPASILASIQQLQISLDFDDSFHLLVQAIPLMRSLNVLSVDLPLCSEMTQNLLGVISHSNVTTLTLKYHSNSNLSDPGFLSSLQELTEPSNKLKDLTIEPTCLLEVAKLNIDTNPLCDILFKPSSLNRLTLKLPYFTEKYFDLLETNSCLTAVHIFGKKVCLPPSIVWQGNRTIEDLRWGHCQCTYWDLQRIRKSIPPDTKLRRFDILVHGFSGPRVERIISSEAPDVP